MSSQLAALQKRALFVWVAAAALVLSTALPMLTSSNPANALQILDRYVDMDSSASDAETNYDVSFQLPDSVTFGAIRVEFCNEDPLPGEACNVSTTEGDSVPELDADAGSAITITNFAVADAPGDTTNNEAVNCPGSLDTAHGAGSNLNYLDIRCNSSTVTTSTGGGAADTDYVNFTITNIDNPDNTTSGTDNDTFYVRIYTFAADASPTAYNAAGAPLGNYEGGLAMSTAQQINVTARVQEELVFQVGADEIADDCATFTQTTVDLGVLDSSGVNFASTDPNAAADSDVACLEVTTNAANGVTVSYIGDNLANGACTGSTDTENGTPDETDLCINSDLDGSDADNNTNSADPDIAAGTEQWGLSVIDDTIDNNPSATTDTTNLTADTVYDGTVTNAGAADIVDNWTFVANTNDIVCSSTTVVNAELCQVDMAGTAAITTPTGIYTTTLTFIATATF